jgi:hypothetical protein
MEEKTFEIWKGTIEEIGGRHREKIHIFQSGSEDLKEFLNDIIEISNDEEHEARAKKITEMTDYELGLLHDCLEDFDPALRWK